MYENISELCLVYSNREENANKYYIMELKEREDGYYLVTKYGRLGKRPAKREKRVKSISFGNSLIAKAYFEKMKKGYINTDIDEIIATGNAFFCE